MLSIQALMSAPNPDDPLDNGVAEVWKNDEQKALEMAKEFTRNFAMKSSGSSWFIIIYNNSWWMINYNWIWDEKKNVLYCQIELCEQFNIIILKPIAQILKMIFECIEYEYIIGVLTK